MALHFSFLYIVGLFNLKIDNRVYILATEHIGNGHIIGLILSNTESKALHRLESDRQRIWRGLEGVRQ